MTFDPSKPQAAKLECVLLLPRQDEEAIGELRGTTETRTAAGYIQYHPAERKAAAP